MESFIVKVVSVIDEGGGVVMREAVGESWRGGFYSYVGSSMAGQSDGSVA
jgi:hypothetical protein